MTATGELILGALLGVSLAVPPGPMNAWIVGASSRSYRAGVATGLGAVTADAILGIVVYTLGRVAHLESVVRFVYVLGAAALAYFTFRLLRGIRQPPVVTNEVGSYAPSLALGLSNPYQILWWLTAGIGFVYVGGPLLLVGLFGALVLWVFFLPAAVRTGTRRSPRVQRAVAFGSAAAMAAFAAYFVALAIFA